MFDWLLVCRERHTIPDFCFGQLRSAKSKTLVLCGVPDTLKGWQTTDMAQKQLDSYVGEVQA